MNRTVFCLVLACLAVPLCFSGCGSDGSNGAPAPTTGTVSGTVVDAVKADALAGVAVKASSDAAGTNVLATATTDATGAYSMSVPNGGAYINFSKQFYTQPGGMFVGIGGGVTTTVNATMSESAEGNPSVSFAAVAGDDFGYGSTVVLAVSANDPNGDTVTYLWENATEDTPQLGTVTGTGTSGSLTFPTMAQAFAPRVSSTDQADVSGYQLEDRFMMLPIFPDTRGAITAKVTVSDGRGQSSSVSLTLNAASVLTGLRNVAIGTRVYLNSGHDNANAWTGTAPGGTAIVFDNASSRTPSFLAASVGVFTVSEGSNADNVTVGNWLGIITGGSGDTVAFDTSCTQTCHNGIFAPDKFTPWKDTGHATIFTKGVNGGSGSSGASCLGCHTTGYDAGAANNGFDDVATAAGFVFPTTRVAGTWDNILRDFPAVARMANIQCESCHGPQTSGAHASTSPTRFESGRVIFSAEMCAGCHGRTTHNIYSQWNTRSSTGRGHSNKLLADDEGTGSTSCARCHGAQGFFMFQSKLKASTAFTLSSGDITGLTSENIQPQTCSACHDPHDATNPNQLRVYDNTPGTLNLPAGFRVAGWGKGALCATCHNTRNGAQASPNQNTKTYLHEDLETYTGDPAGSGNPISFSAPHTASQADVVAGRNAYFMGASLPMISRHAAIEDVCVGCHMKNQPKTFTSHGTQAPKGHLFRIQHSDLLVLCSKCHGEDQVNGEGIQASIETGLANLEAKIGAAAKAKINDNTINAGVRWVRAFNVATDLYSSTDPDGSSGSQLAPANVTFDVNTNPVVSVGLEEGHGQIEFHLTLTNPITITWSDNSVTTTSEFGVQLGSLQLSNTTTASLQTPLYGVSTSKGPRPGTSKMVRACWNFFLIEADDSKGIHNPTFAQQVLNASLGQDLSN